MVPGPSAVVQFTARSPALGNGEARDVRARLERSFPIRAQPGDPGADPNHQGDFNRRHVSRLMRALRAFGAHAMGTR